MAPSAILRHAALGLALGLASTARADDKALQGAAYQASVEQEQIRTQTRRLMSDMNKMLEEFRNNPAATGEVVLTEATIQKLQSLSDKDMADVVTSLRDASNPKNSATADKVLSANKNAREIQSTLVKLADKLALFQDEASVDLRLGTLMRRQLANQRQVTYLQNGIVASEDTERESTLAATEQKALKDEIDSLMDNLKGLAANKDSSDQSVFGTIYAAANTAQITTSSDAAQASTATKAFPAASDAQAKVVKALQSMLLALNSGKSMEERLRTAESQMRSLAIKQEQLARTTTGTSPELQLTIARHQNEIADQRTILEMEVAQLNGATSPLLDQSRQAMDDLDSTLRKNRGLIGNPDKKLQVVNQQNGVAGQFRQIAELLKKKNEVASASGGDGGGSDAATDAMTDAASSISDAMSHMDMAQNLLNQGGDTGAAQDQMNQAQGNLNDAMKNIGAAGNVAPQGAGKNIDQSKSDLGKGSEQAKSSGASDRQAANSSVGQAKEQAQQALTALRQAINDRSSADAGQMIANGQSNNPNQQGTDTGSGAGWGGLFHHKNASSTFDAISKISEKDPDALPALQRERAPSEYDSMDQQYMKNLAEGSVPTQ